MDGNNSGTTGAGPSLNLAQRAVTMSPTGPVPEGCDDGIAAFETLNEILQELDEIHELLVYLKPRIDEVDNGLVCFDLKVQLELLIDDNFPKWTDGVN